MVLAKDTRLTATRLASWAPAQAHTRGAMVVRPDVKNQDGQVVHGIIVAGSRNGEKR
jgi:hypothetical protein